jgi:ribonucleoside-triphosphate reductase
MPFAMDDAHEAAVAELEAKAAPAKKFLLFTTTTCPKCRMAKMFLDNSGIEYETVIAEEHPDLVALYGIKEAPTLVIVAGDKAERISNPSNIRAFCDQLVKA